MAGSRYCDPECRRSAWRQRRALARTALLVSLADTEAALARTYAALKVLGLRPARPRHGGTS
jgi:hypothetical protein